MVNFSPFTEQVSLKMAKWITLEGGEGMFLVVEWVIGLWKKMPFAAFKVRNSGFKYIRL